MSLCDACADESMKWLDYRLPPPGIVLINPGVTNVDSVLAARAARTQDWKDTITSQQNLIKDICERNHHAQA